MSVEQIYDIEGIVETAGKKVLEALGLKAFTTRDAPDFKKDRPRIELKLTLGQGCNRFTPIYEGQVVTAATPNMTPSLVFFCRRETAWYFKLQFVLLTRDNMEVHAAYRAAARNALAQFWLLINGAPPLTRHCIQMDRDNGSSEIEVSPEHGLMKTEMSFDGTVSIQADAWPALNQV